VSSKVRPQASSSANMARSAPYPWNWASSTCARADALMTKRSAPDHLGRAASFAGAPNRAKHRGGAARIGDQCGEPRPARLDFAGPLQPPVLRSGCLGGFHRHGWIWPFAIARVHPRRRHARAALVDDDPDAPVTLSMAPRHWLATFWDGDAHALRSRGYAGMWGMAIRMPC